MLCRGMCPLPVDSFVRKSCRILAYYISTLSARLADENVPILVSRLARRLNDFGPVAIYAKWAIFVECLREDPLAFAFVFHASRLRTSSFPSLVIE